MKFIIYKTTNIINEKYYIGMHRTEEPNDDYLGSGVALQRSIKKYGKENFKKEILFVFDTEIEMQNKEKELVNEDVVNDANSYNMTIGGKGSWSHINSSGENNPNYGKALWKEGKTEEEIDEINRKRASPGEKNGMYGKTHTEEVRKKLSEINSVPLHERVGEEKAKELKKLMSNRWKGKPKSEEQKRKMSESAKARWANKKLNKN